MTQAFDLASLKPGDEVGIERCDACKWETRSAGRVIAIHDNSMIELEGSNWYWPDGSNAYNVFSADTLRLAAPTDEGRRLSLQETVSEELRTLASHAYEVDLPTLRRLKAWIDARGWENQS